MKKIILLCLMVFALQADFVKKVINLKPLKNENKFRVEIEFGKNILVDCNIHFFLNSKILPLKSENNFKFIGDDEVASTRMLCYGKKKNKFVKYNEVLKLDYNSKIPIIIYLKKDVKILLKIFKEITREFK